MDPLWTEQKLKGTCTCVRRLQITRVYKRKWGKDFTWKITPWNALLEKKTQLKQLSTLHIENNRFILNTCHNTAKRAETVGFPVIFSRLRWPFEPKFSQVCYFRYKLWYTKCGLLDKTFFRCCANALKRNIEIVENRSPISCAK